MKTKEEVAKLIEEEFDGIKRMVLKKNNDYGNSVFEPLGVFSTLNPTEQIRVRLDDKLKRIQNLLNLNKTPDVAESIEDTERDIVGYIVLMHIYKKVIEL